MYLNRQFINYQLKLSRKRRLLLSAVFLLSLFGLLEVYNVSSIYAWSTYGDSMYFFKKQLFFFFLGIFGMSLFLVLPLEYLQRHSKLFLAGGILLLVFVLIWGRKIGGARRWLKIGSFGFQPSELVKIFFVIYLSDYLIRKRFLILNFKKGVLPLLIISGFISGLILIEPDFGNAVFFIILTFIYLFLAGARKKHLFWLSFLGIIAVVILVLVSPYRRERLLFFLNPWADSQGKGFQLVQSEIGLGSGRLLGRGLGESIQKLFFLPAAHTDFIYSIIGEELGFAGSCLILFVYLFIFIQGFFILRYVNDPFKFYVGAGSLLILVLMALINIGVVVGVFPTKGLPLPFISYGGTTTVVNFSLLGLFLNASRQV